MSDRPELSLRRFARYAGVSYWRLRDFKKAADSRKHKQEQGHELREQVKRMALLHPTYGYRFLYQELRAKGEQVGLHRVRQLLGELGLNPPQPRKTRKPSPEVVAAPDWPTGRRIQIDATRLSLADGVCWVYHVLDLESRVVLTSKAVRSLSMHLAKAALDEGVAVLRSLGVHSTVLIQSDGSSDFTGEVFQSACLRYGGWVRSKVSQKGGMGMLERLNRTYKYSFAFRQDWNSLAEVQVALPDFHRWYNRERTGPEGAVLSKTRRHSALNYNTPWATLTGAANPRLAV